MEDNEQEMFSVYARTSPKSEAKDLTRLTVGELLARCARGPWEGFLIGFLLINENSAKESDA